MNVETPTGLTIQLILQEGADRERERCAKIADQYANNAEYRAAGHDDKAAKAAALDKMEAGREIAAAIRSANQQLTKDDPETR